MTRKLFLSLALGATFLCAPAATAKTLDSERAEGRFATASVSAVIEQPRRVSAHLQRSPSQPARVTWNATCESADGAREEIGGEANLAKAQRLKLKLGMRRGERCVVAVVAQLEGRGQLKLSLDAHKKAKR